MQQSTNAIAEVDNELRQWCDDFSITQTLCSPSPERQSSNDQHVRPLSIDRSHPAIHLDMNACIRCTRCIRACREIQGNDVLGLAYRGHQTQIVFDQHDSIIDSSCVACGQCVQVCPTGALSSPASTITADKKTDSVCPYCGVGCLTTYHSKNNQIIRVDGRDGPANLSKLCVKGRFGADYAQHPDRLTQPMIRKKTCPKDATLQQYDSHDPLAQFEAVSWQEAIDFAASGLERAEQTQSGTAIAGFGSAKCSNEEGYLFQKLLRTRFKTNHVDHCSRLCHASSVVALLEGIGSGAVSNQVDDIMLADVAIIIGANASENHPVAASVMRQAQQEMGTQLIVMDPRKIDLMHTADIAVQFAPDSDVALLNALIYTIIDEQLTNDAFILERSEDFERIKDNITHYSPEAMSAICDVPVETIRQVARTYAKAQNAMIFWGMGITQHVHGTDNARCLITLALMTGQIGRAGAGLHPLRGQNNVQGTSDMGVLPMFYPDYQRIDSETAQQKFETLWQTPLNPTPGLMSTEVFDAIEQQQITAMYIMGENPAMSDADLNHARQVLSQLPHLIIQDIFFTETAYFADVIFPASAFFEKTGTFTNTDRRVQLGQQVLEPPQGVMQDWQIIQALAKRLGLNWQYASVDDIFTEITSTMPSHAGMRFEDLVAQSSITYPKTSRDSPSECVIFKDSFPTASGRGRFVPVHYQTASELPDADFPYVLLTGRQLEHWHTGTMTRHSEVLNALEPSAFMALNDQDMALLNVQVGDKVKVCSRRGQIELPVELDNGLRQGEAFMPFSYAEAAANILTNHQLDPYSKIPEYKFCAIRIEKV